MLKAVKPEIIPDAKPKMMLSGGPGVGKSLFALEFPKVYYIDTEGGATRRQYKKKLGENGGGYFGKEQGSRDFQAVIEEVKALATIKHDYKTLVIDSFSHLYNTAASIAEEKLGNAFAKDKKEANRPSRQLIRWLENLDMTVILVCHKREKWERRGGEIINVGTTFDGFDKMEYILDLWIEAIKFGPDTRNFVVKKSRIETLPEGKELPLDYKTFSEVYGRQIIEKQSVPIALATPDLVERLNRLVVDLKLEEEQKKWLEKAEVTAPAEMTREQINKCIDFCTKKLNDIATAK